MTSFVAKSAIKSINVDFVEPRFYLGSKIRYGVSFPRWPRGGYVLSNVKSFWNNEDKINANNHS